MGRTAVANPSFALATLVMIILYAEICQGGVFNSDGSSYGNQDGYEDEEFENFESGPFLPVVPGIGMGLDPSQLQNLLSSFGEPEVYDIPAVSEHVYGSPSKVVIGGYDGPIKKLQGTIQSFHQVRTIDNGGHAVESSMHRSIDQYVGKMTSHHKRSEYDDFSFPADW